MAFLALFYNHLLSSLIFLPLLCFRPVLLIIISINLHTDRVFGSNMFKLLKNLLLENYI